MHEVEAPRLKLQWAHKHLTLLDAEIAKLSAERGCELILQGDAKPGTLRYMFRVKEADIPADVGLIVGDLVHNLRSSLDHLYCQLARILTGRDPPDDVTFPIFESGRRRSRIELNKRLKALGDTHAARNLIRQFQPYHMGQLSNQHPLALIHRLDVIDKHQRITVANYGLSISFNIAPDARVAIVREALDDGQVFSWHWEPAEGGTGTSDVNAEADIILAVRFKAPDRTYVFATISPPISELHTAYDYVEGEVFGKLASFFAHD